MTKNLTEGSPARLILMFTLPLIAGNIFQQLYAFVDTLIVGRFLGVEALAAVGCTGSLMFLMLGFVIGFSTGITIYTGQRYGAKDYAGVRQSAAACAVLSFLEAVVLQTPPEILEGAYSFISIVFGGIVMFVCLQTQTNLLRALGDSRMPTVILATALIINIILEPIAILVLGWGIPGAALATIVDLLSVHLQKGAGAPHVSRRLADELAGAEGAFETGSAHGLSVLDYRHRRGNPAGGAQ